MLESHSCKSPAISNCDKVADEEFEAVSEGTNTWRRTQLPEDSVMEILLRLPVKSLVRFKSFCKIWYDLIRSPNFVTAHYKITSLKKKVPIFFFYRYGHYSCSQSSPDAFSFCLSDIPIGFTIHDRCEPLLVGCYNGLICLCLSHRLHREFLLWNPATTQARIINITGLNRVTHTPYYSGLCFDSAANTHKIARIRFFLEDNAKFVNMTVPKGKVYVIAYFYTLKDDSWRLEKLFAPCRLPNGGEMSEITHLMRFMCWMVSGDKDKYILCLDMVEEVFNLIELPSPDYIYCRTKLVDYKGSIALLVWKKSASDSRGGHCSDLWVLNGCDGTGQSWCKELASRSTMNDIELGKFTYSESLASVY